VIEAIEISAPEPRLMLGAGSLVSRILGYEPLPRAISWLQLTSSAPLRYWMLPTGALCAVIWPASNWLAARIVQAQELCATTLAWAARPTGDRRWYNSAQR